MASIIAIPIIIIQTVLTIIILNKKNKQSKKYLITSIITFAISTISFIIFNTLFITIKYTNDTVYIIETIIASIFVSQLAESIILLIIGIILKIKEKQKQKQQILLNEFTKSKSNDIKISYCEYCGCKIKSEETKCPNCSAVIKK